MGKLRASVGNDARNWAFLAAGRASNVTSPGDDIAHDFPRFRGILGDPWVSVGSFGARHGSIVFPLLGKANASSDPDIYLAF